MCVYMCVYMCIPTLQSSLLASSFTVIPSLMKTSLTLLWNSTYVLYVTSQSTHEGIGPLSGVSGIGPLSGINPLELWESLQNNVTTTSQCTLRIFHVRLNTAFPTIQSCCTSQTSPTRLVATPRTSLIRTSITKKKKKSLDNDLRHIGVQ